MHIGLMPELLAVDLADRRENLACALGARTDPEGDEVLATLRRILDDRPE